jgi:hypothetical protein
LGNYLSGQDPSTPAEAGAHLESRHIGVEFIEWSREDASRPSINTPDSVAAVIVRWIVDPTRVTATVAIALTGHTLVAAFAVELLVVLALCYLATSGSHRDDSLYGLAIGFTTMASAFAVSVIAGGAFNPAVSLGAAVTLAVYLVAQVLGGITAAVSLLALNPMTTEPLIQS